MVLIVFMQREMLQQVKQQAQENAHQSSKFHWSLSKLSHCPS